MYRNKTVEAMQRAAERRERDLLAMIREQNDRIADLAGRPWTPSPASVKASSTPEPQAEEYVWSPEDLPVEERFASAGFFPEVE